MSLRPHLHLLVSSSTSSILLETRIYLPARLHNGPLIHLLSQSTTSSPCPLDNLTKELRLALKSMGLKRIITAAHPWGRLGGNMLFPVLSHHLPEAVYSGPSGDFTAVTTFNVRGIGRSGGSLPWYGVGSDYEDFAAVEQEVIELIGGEPDIYRLGYSFGTLLALNAPVPSCGVKRMMLVSPAPTLFRALTFGSRSFQTGLTAALECPALSVWLVHGTSDEFTSVNTFIKLGDKNSGRMVRTKVEGCGHFYSRPEDVVMLKAAITGWLETV